VFTWEFLVDRGIIQRIADRLTTMNGVSPDQLAQEDPRRLFEQLMRFMYEFNSGFIPASTFPINIHTNVDVGMEMGAVIYDDLPPSTMVSVAYFHDSGQPLTICHFYKGNQQ